jgi:hypothetical protein
MKIKELHYQEHAEIIFVEIDQQTLFSIQPMRDWDKTIHHYYIKFIGVIPRYFFKHDGTAVWLSPETNSFNTIEEAKLECKKIVENFINFFIEE